jgi:hypothetical protein
MFEKRIATPQKKLYETTAADADADESLEERIIDDKPVYFTEDNEAGNLKPNGQILYENYRIVDSEFNASGGVENGEAGYEEEFHLIPVFTRTYYKSDGWADISKNPVSVTSAEDYDVKDNTQLYQQWTSNTFNIIFDMNGKGTQLDGINTVAEAKSAEGGLAADGKTLPTPGTVTESGVVKYNFKNWADAGGNIIGQKTPLYHKDGADSVTLYAQWVLDGFETSAFSYTGNVQEWTVPLTGIYEIKAVGAGKKDDNYHGGYGGYIHGNIALTQGVKLYIYVGGQGESALIRDNTMGSIRRKGGWNGGGQSGGMAAGYSSGSGGNGASDIRTDRGVSDDDWGSALDSRIMVAGGGGGAGGGSSYSGGGGSGNGGYGKASGGEAKDKESNSGAARAYGGSLTGGGGSYYGNAYNPGRTNGALGKGGDGGNAGKQGGGGGGSGYWGGGGSIYTTYNNQQHFSGGGGGSSWAETDSNKPLYFIEKSLPAAKDGGGTNDGNGKVEITFISPLSTDN